MLTFEEIEDCFPEGGGTTDNGSAIVSAQWLHDFARAVETKEREACAKACEEWGHECHGEGRDDSEAFDCADHIRARSNIGDKLRRD